MTDITAIREQRAAFFAVEAQNDLPQLHAASAALAAPAVDKLVKELEAAATNLADPVRQNNVRNLAVMIGHTRTILTTNIAEAQVLLPAPDAPE